MFRKIKIKKIPSCLRINLDYSEIIVSSSPSHTHTHTTWQEFPCPYIYILILSIHSRSNSAWSCHIPVLWLFLSGLSFTRIDLISDRCFHYYLPANFVNFKLKSILYLLIEVFVIISISQFYGLRTRIIIFFSNSYHVLALDRMLMTSCTSSD